MNINLHHLELFYYVARHGGLGPAAKRMPYGIQPSTVSRQLCQLERQTGLQLYERRPFKLTAVGEKLFAFIKPILEDLPVLVQRLGQRAPDLVRLGASPVVLRDYLPSIVPLLRRNFPDLRLTCNEGLQWQIEVWLKEKMIDLGVTTIEGELPADCLCEPLLRLPMILLVPSHSRLRSATELWRAPHIEETLIGPGAQDAISRSFHQGLQRHGVEWSVGMEANSIELVETYVAEGFGFGMSLALPGRDVRAGLRALPLPDFPRVPVGMIWQRNPNAATQVLMRELRRAAQQLIKSSRRVALCA